jgi:hypothetical protein
MKKSLSFAILVSAFALLLIAQAGCASPPSTNTSGNATPTPEPAPDKTAIEAELTKVENDWPRMIKERDGAAIRRLEGDDILIVYPDGGTGTKEQDAKDIEAGTVSADSWEISDLKISVLDKDSAVVTLRNTVNNGKLKAPDGKLIDISGQYRSLDTFARRNGQWQLVATSSVKIQTPSTATTTAPKSSPSPGASPAARATPTPRATPRPTPALKGTPVPRPPTKPAATPPQPKTT